MSFIWPVFPVTLASARMYIFGRFRMESHISVMVEFRTRFLLLAQFLSWFNDKNILYCLYIPQIEINSPIMKGLSFCNVLWFTLQKNVNVLSMCTCIVFFHFCVNQLSLSKPFYFIKFSNFIHQAIIQNRPRKEVSWNSIKLWSPEFLGWIDLA